MRSGIQMMMMGLVLAAMAITGVQCACDPSLTLSDGPVVGVCNTTLPNIAFRSFLGIPYGADTSGANRFMPPQPPAKWSTPLKAHAFGPGCPQTDHNPDVPTLQSEDCLSINVWTPFDAKAGDNLPVTLWIYGGTFKEGGASVIDGLYRGDMLTSLRNDTIFVSFNYRLAGLGFLNLPPATGQETNGPVLAGNQGLQDQRAAMKWVRDNIAAFGGDPDHVMIQGESAGGMSIICHLTSPASEGLFTSALIESGVPGYRYRSADYSAFQGIDFASQLGCLEKGEVGTGTLFCMQQKPLQDVLQAIRATSKDAITFLLDNGLYPMDGFVNWSPIVTGPGTQEIPEQPLEAIQAGRFVSGLKSVVLGTNTNESVAFLGNKGTNVNSIEYELALIGLFGSAGYKAIKAYDLFTPPADPLANGIPAMEQWLTAYWFACPSRAVARAFQAHGVPSYLYLYGHILSFPVFGKYLPQCKDYVCHGTEMPLMFDHSAGYTFSAGEKYLTHQMMSYSLSASAYHNPNQGWSPTVQWPAYDPSTNLYVFLNDTISTGKVPSYCDVFDKLTYNH